ncbi:MAG: ABC transporter substrate-binding protein [Spirochaetaceae bacterium]|nr:ABC transporter substrate-binding protein [Spirochaetaceae bacterium]
MKLFFANVFSRAAFVFLATVIAFSGCAPSRQADTEKEAAVELIDFFGRTVRLKELPKRIVSLAPNMTETLFLLGAGGLLVGRTDYCDYPPEALAAPSVGSITDPNMEHILSLGPDLVVGSTHFQKETLEALENLGIAVYLGIIRSDWEEIFRMIMDVALITGKTAEAQAIVEDMRSRKAAVEEAVSKAEKKPRVYYLISFGEAGDYTAGRGTFIASIIESAGAINAGDDIEGWRYSVEALFRDEPDIILCGRGTGGAGSGTPEELRRAPPYNRLRAVREGRVYVVDNDLLDRIGPRNISGLEMLAKLFHAELFP